MRASRGVDEAGMSRLPGRVVAAAVILPRDFHGAGIDDSKKLSAEQREELAPVIRRNAIAWATGSVDPEEIDRHQHLPRGAARDAPRGREAVDQA